MELELSDPTDPFQIIISLLSKAKFQEAYSHAESLPDTSRQAIAQCIALIGQGNLYMANNLIESKLDINNASAEFAALLVHACIDPEDVYMYANSHNLHTLSLLCLRAWKLLAPEKKKDIWDKMLLLSQHSVYLDSLQRNKTLIKRATLVSSLEEFIIYKEPDLNLQLQRLIKYHEVFCKAPWYKEKLEYEVAESLFKQTDLVGRIVALSYLLDENLENERTWVMIECLFTLLVKEEVDQKNYFVDLLIELREERESSRGQYGWKEGLPQKVVKLLLNLSYEYRLLTTRKYLKSYVYNIKRNHFKRKYNNIKGRIRSIVRIRSICKKEYKGGIYSFGVKPARRVLFVKPPEPVLLGASSPQVVKKGTEFTARFMAYISELEQEVERKLLTMSPRSTNHIGVKICQWRPGTKIRVRLYGNYLSVNPFEEEFIWNSKMNIVDFDVVIQNDAPEIVTVLKFDVSIEGIIVAKLRIDLQIASTDEESLRKRVSAKPIRTAFASYASQDRPRVLDRISEIRRNGVHVFLDCLSMSPGEQWKLRLEKEINECESFLLFWSSYAKQSEWVTWEWRTALNHKGISAIEPHPLCPISEAEPPEELKELHFGDVYMLVREASGKE